MMKDGNELDEGRGIEVKDVCLSGDTCQRRSKTCHNDLDSPAVRTADKDRINIKPPWLTVRRLHICYREGDVLVRR